MSAYSVGVSSRPTRSASVVRQLCQAFGGQLLHRPASNELHCLVKETEHLQSLCQRLRDDGFYLVTVVANDERELEDYGFRLYYLFSHPRDDLFLTVENPLEPGVETYTSIYDWFVGVGPFEREAVDLLGLYPRDSSERVTNGDWLHDGYPPGLYPLRRDQTTETIKAAIKNYESTQIHPSALKGGVSPPSAERVAYAHPPQAFPASRTGQNGQRPPDGEWFLPVGPVHAGVIEPGHFLFRVAGEAVEELTIRLGYTHRGIERLFQVSRSLADGWQLAEQVSGDAPFAHSLAYCRAAESLAGVRAPHRAELLRGLFLELERLANHVGDCGALAHDVALDVVASEMGVLREHLLRLHGRLSGHRLLRGLNRPGGVILARSLSAHDVDDVRATVERVTNKFFGLAHSLAEMPGFRRRTINLGVLTTRQALELGATGLAARASGLDRDFRLNHPAGIYREPEVRALLEVPGAGFEKLKEPEIVLREATAGDVLARFLTRVREVQTSAAIIAYTLAQWGGGLTETHLVTHVDFSQVPNFEFGIGYAEGWRGDVVYWLMKDKFERIYRCKVRDPSLLNWPALKAAVEPHVENGRNLEIILPDFPLVNKSFNLSYAGNDL
jgi:Ni,Fe-hydrogenase III large subunit/Ni,Fe-hydrogenase III component G